MTDFTSADIPDLVGETVIVTGANSGLGREEARAFAAAGARVVLAVRDTDKGTAAAAALPGTTGVRPLDLASLASVRAFAAAWTGGIRLLVNNAGVMAPPLTRTADGFESQFGAIPPRGRGGDGAIVIVRTSFPR
ncbi:MAG TPA: SDR family NAD(P)-dependent oxidoreductase [Trebonia sp.]|nr:SDR family NAD(P)-dependent oxidoreductase [Trebonia sp.]